MGKKKKIVLIILVSITALIVIVSVIGYFLLNEEKPWMAFYIACCGGVLTINLLASIFLVNKNMKNKK